MNSYIKGVWVWIVIAVLSVPLWVVNIQGQFSPLWNWASSQGCKMCGKKSGSMN
jgi:membrane-bound metal-dependent hydrolase YbcI (DUF457 family)